MAAAASSIVTDVAGYPEALKQLHALPAPRLVVFSSDLNEAGVPWCPDCERAVPVLQAAAAAAGGALLEVRVGPRPVWKDPQHPFRQPSSLGLSGIPTLVLVKDGELGARLGAPLEAASTASEVEQLVAGFLKENA